MEHASYRLLPKVLFDASQDALVVIDERRDVMLIAVANWIPAVVAEIIDEAIEPLYEFRPKGVVGINREAIAVTYDKPMPPWIAVSPDGNAHAVRYGHLEHSGRIGNLPA
jgi:hypothetical protein